MTSTPGCTRPISAAGPNRSTRVPRSAARAAPAATSAGPRSAPPASTATVTTAGTSVDVLVPLRDDYLAPLIAAAYGADPVRKARAVALRARVVGRRADLVLRATLRGPRVGLLLLGDGHVGQCNRPAADETPAGRGTRRVTRSAAPTAPPSGGRANAHAGAPARPR